jgi:hypothetical protein
MSFSAKKTPLFEGTRVPRYNTLPYCLTETDDTMIMKIIKLLFDDNDEH